MLAAGALASGCGTSSPPEGQVGHIAENYGGVVSDEPRSAIVGRDILSAGGNAVDAAVATYFTLAVTYPHAATLGGGGICVVFQAGKTSKVEALDFRPLMVERNGAVAAIPGAVRGMAALHARYGRQSWESLLLPAERLARFGNPVARAFARQIAEMPDDVFADEQMRKLFTVDGERLKEGQILREVRLASTLGRIRLRGGGDFYTGELAAQIVEGLNAASGAGLAIEDVRNYLPTWIATSQVEVGNHEAHIPAGPEGERLVGVWKRMADGREISLADADTARRDFDSAGFGAVDRDGNAVACVVGANGRFGAARLIGTTGIVEAGSDRAVPQPGLPVVIANRPRGDAIGVVTGSGRAGAALRAVSTGVSVFERDVAPGTALSPGGRDVRANVISCPEGARGEPEACRFAVDPGGFGLAAGAAL